MIKYYEMVIKEGKIVRNRKEEGLIIGWYENDDERFEEYHKDGKVCLLLTKTTIDKGHGWKYKK